jgi:hypothetical protein
MLGLVVSSVIAASLPAGAPVAAGASCAPVASAAALALDANIGADTDADEAETETETEAVAALMDEPAAGQVSRLAAPAAAAERLWATPAVIDCRVPVRAPVLQALVGECDGAARDFSYRASRDADSERAPGSLRPARRDRRAADQLAAAAGLPSEGGDGGASGLQASQPLALFALPAPPCFVSARYGDATTVYLPSRQLRPLERPPRA